MSAQMKLRVATVGTGYFSQFHYEAWHRMADVELVALCNRSAVSAEEYANRYAVPVTYTDFAEMLEREKPDLVDIITPPETHMDYVRLALARDIPVVCQKPFTPSLAEAEKLVAEIDAAGGKVVIHENFRFQPWNLHLRYLLGREILGQLYQVTFRLRPGDGQGADAYLGRQPYFRKMERFLIHETAIHLIDVFRFLLGEANSVYAQLDRLNPVIAGEDAGIFILNFQDGTRAVFDGNRLADHAAEDPRRTMGEMRIEGAKGELSLDGNGVIRFRAHGNSQAEEMPFDWQDRGFGGDCVYLLNRHVVDHMLHGAPLMNEARDYLTNLRIEEAIYQSHAQAMRIDLQLNTQ